ncbi:L-rhamnose mutarotase [Reichenbachiella ulvae]|uniref:L-rhamnose mutarotase n=1 Tax=Reichenbachiella ulvae TaxID=2980104 RepID=A0ABT3CTY8_9BACT|nr:L-rhamnose mutarotase [Reichenbachiella ulvae]MCV9386698.1 L-rhamnose mutarotase [Reichenbachiella ulvae]
METIAFKMKLKSGCKEEYKQRHNNIWPELKELLKDSGVVDYVIFFDEETDTLFACQKVRDGQNSQQLGGEKIVQTWWAYMADIMETHEDNSPISIQLEEVFKLR